jgi:hypothetical protein
MLRQRFSCFVITILFSNCFSIGKVEYLKPGPEYAQIKSEISRTCGIVLMTSALSDTFRDLEINTKSKDWTKINLTKTMSPESFTCIYVNKYDELGAKN